MAERSCPTCGDTFERTRGRRYCSEPCWPSRRPRFAGEPSEEQESAAVEPCSYDELVSLLWRSARKGSVAAMVTLRRELRDHGEPSIVDELAKPRGKA